METTAVWDGKVQFCDPEFQRLKAQSLMQRFAACPSAALKAGSEGMP